MYPVLDSITFHFSPPGVTSKSDEIRVERISEAVSLENEQQQKKVPVCVCELQTDLTHNNIPGSNEDHRATTSREKGGHLTVYIPSEIQWADIKMTSAITVFLWRNGSFFARLQKVKPDYITRTHARTHSKPH